MRIYRPNVVDRHRVYTEDCVEQRHEILVINVVTARSSKRFLWLGWFRKPSHGRATTPIEVRSAAQAESVLRV